ncbi:MAG: hypothetical protein ACI4D4_04015 [Lachnospira sp.]
MIIIIMKYDFGKEGWNIILDEVVKAKDGGVVIVNMNGASVVPVDVINNATRERKSQQVSLSL